MTKSSLAEHLATQLARRLNERRVVVWYDPRREFEPFVAELRGSGPRSAAPQPVRIGPLDAHLAEYDGSFFEVRAAVEPLVAGDDPEPLLVYVPGIERDELTSPLLELELGGDRYQPQLKRLARSVLEQRYSYGEVDELLQADRVGWEELQRASIGDGHVSLLNLLFAGSRGAEDLIARWLAEPGRDEEIQARGAVAELAKLLRSRLGMAAASGAPLARLRAVAARYVLAAEYRDDLRCAPPPALDAVDAPRTREELATAREVARRLRADHPAAYEPLADRVASELGLEQAPVPAEALGAIDTFRFEERLLLEHCGMLVAAGRHAEALAIVAERADSYWLLRHPERAVHWAGCRLMAELGMQSAAVRSALERPPASAAAWVAEYVAPDGWHRMDRAQRALEEVAAPVDLLERPLAAVRRAYDDACAALASGFTRALDAADWAVEGVLRQTDVHADAVARRAAPVAYVLVDALRWEMGVALAELLPPPAEVSLRPAIAVLPTVTPLGMAALMPGAAADFTVATGGRLVARVDGAELPDANARRRHVAARVPGAVDVTLDEVLSSPTTRLAKKVAGAPLVVVRSQEIDAAGEQGHVIQARLAMDAMVTNLARAFRKLAAAGVEHAVVSADHGHLFHPTDRDDSLRIDPPGGATVELHRRAWVGRGGATPAGCIRIAAARLGYEADVDFVFPVGLGVFRCAGGLAFHHGGPSLQELVVPVVSVRLPTAAPAKAPKRDLGLDGLPDAVTNRIFTVRLVPGATKDLFREERPVRALLLSGGRQVGDVRLAQGAALDDQTRAITLSPATPATVAFLLQDDTVLAVRVVVVDDASDAELVRSPDIPVRLGV